MQRSKLMIASVGDIVRIYNSVLDTGTPSGCYIVTTETETSTNEVVELPYELTCDYYAIERTFTKEDLDCEREFWYQARERRQPILSDRPKIFRRQAVGRRKRLSRKFLEDTSKGGN